MLRIIAAITSLFWLMTANAGEISHFPNPQGFIESSTLVPSLKEQALIGHPRTTRLIGVYLLPDDLAAILHGQQKSLSIICRAYELDQSSTEDGARSAFQSLVYNAKKEASLTETLETKRIIQHYADATKSALGYNAAITGSTNLGSIIDVDDAYGSSIIVAATAEMNGTETSVPITASVAWVRHGNKIFELSSMAQFSGEDSIKNSSELTIKWVNSVLSEKAEL